VFQSWFKFLVVEGFRKERDEKALLIRLIY
jgi:hypothetical protein